MLFGGIRLKRLWFNADDFGLSAGVCEGIVEAMNVGAVGTTSAMVARDGAAVLIERFAAPIQGRIGLHLQLTDGRPVLPPKHVPSLVDGAGRFPRARRHLGPLDPDDIAREWTAQLAKLRELRIEPTHIDSHHHVHALPEAIDVYVSLAHEQQLPARAITPRLRKLLRHAGVPTADRFSSRFYADATSLDALVGIVARAGRRLGDLQTLEIMCHPAQPDAALAQCSDYVEQRRWELQTLCRPELPADLRALDFQLVSGPQTLGVCHA